VAEVSGWAVAEVSGWPVIWLPMVRAALRHAALSVVMVAFSAALRSFRSS
jgi:hypothetical protein